jgi:hypothetical protein
MTTTNVLLLCLLVATLVIILRLGKTSPHHPLDELNEAIDRLDTAAAKRLQVSQALAWVDALDQHPELPAKLPQYADTVMQGVILHKIESLAGSLKLALDRLEDHRKTYGPSTRDTEVSRYNAQIAQIQAELDAARTELRKIQPLKSVN